MTKWIPTEGGYLNASLPGELIRGQVITLCSENVAIVQLLTAPISKHLPYLKDQAVPLKRTTDVMGQEIWAVITEQEMALAVDEDERLRAEREAEKARIEAEEKAKAPKHHAFNVVT